MSLQTIKERIKKHEGFKDMIYEDHLGFKTIGYGHKVVEDGILPGIQYSKEELEKIFDKDFDYAVQSANEILDPDIHSVARGVVIEMIFQLGKAGVLKFKNFLAALKFHQYSKAADEMLDSLWFKQTPKRCQELSTVMRSCDTST